jgi:hypothetical protein
MTDNQWLSIASTSQSLSNELHGLIAVIHIMFVVAYLLNRNKPKKAISPPWIWPTEFKPNGRVVLNHKRSKGKAAL